MDLPPTFRDVRREHYADADRILESLVPKGKAGIQSTEKIYLYIFLPLMYRGINMLNDIAKPLMKDSFIKMYIGIDDRILLNGSTV